jgi:hypothetical protein
MLWMFLTWTKPLHQYTREHPWDLSPCRDLHTNFLTISGVPRNRSIPGPNRLLYSDVYDTGTRLFYVILYYHRPFWLEGCICTQWVVLYTHDFAVYFSSNRNTLAICYRYVAEVLVIVVVAIIIYRRKWFESSLICQYQGDFQSAHVPVPHRPLRSLDLQLSGKNKSAL